MQFYAKWILEGPHWGTAMVCDVVAVWFIDVWKLYSIEHEP
jgi:hypothetical protein